MKIALWNGLKGYFGRGTLHKGYTGFCLMEKKTTYNCTVFIRTEVAKDGTALVCMRVNITHEKPYVENLQIRVKPAWFDNEKREVKEACPDCNDLNMMIRNAVARANNIFVRYRLAMTPLSIADFKREYPLATANHSSFYEFYEKSTNHAYKKKVIAESTWMKEATTLNQLKEYAPALSFAEMNKDFLIGFDKYQEKEDKTQNTRWCYWKHISKFCNQAVDAGYMLKNPCEEYIVRQVPGEIVALTQQQVKDLHNYYNGEKITTVEHNVLQHFLFSCFTGLRISDIKALTEANFKGDSLVFSQVKGRSHSPKITSVPLHGIALSFLKEEKGKIFTKLYADQAINRVLKRIASKNSITEKVTTHVGRHTFATTFLERGGKVEVLKEYMGHSNIKDTMRYVHITEARKRDQIAVFDGFF